MGRICFVCTLPLPFVCGNLSLAPEMQRFATPVTVPCLPSFPSKDGLLGGDGGTSIMRPDGRILWLFADSFAGRVRERSRTHCHGDGAQYIAGGAFDIRGGLAEGEWKNFLWSGEGWYWPMEDLFTKIAFAYHCSN